MVNYAGLKERFQYINGLYVEHKDKLLQLQDEAKEILPYAVSEEVSDTVPSVKQQFRHTQTATGIADRCTAFLNDPVTIFRFLRKAHFDSAAAFELLRKTLLWRVSTSVDLVSPSSLEPIYSERPVFYLHPHVHDTFGRPAAVLSLQHVVRTEDGSLDALREYIAFQMEVARRYLADQTHLDVSGAPKVQIVLLLDLCGANLSNFEIELLPFVVDILKNHFPGMVGAIYVLNYGWAYAGMWQIARRLLPKVTLERILFPSAGELFACKYFDKQHMLLEHGGTLKYRYRLSSNAIMMKYGRPSYFLRGLRLSSTVVTPSASTAASPAPSRPLSRTGSFESLRSTDTTFHSFTSTPRQASVTSFGDHATSSSSGQPHKHTPSWLGMTRADKPGARIATFSNHVSPLSSPKTASRALAIQEEGRSREDSIEQLRDQLQQQDVRSTDQSRAVRSGKTSGTVSPYNVNNPYYGYPATRYAYTDEALLLGDSHDNAVSNHTIDRIKLPHARPFHARRRKRDLLRTLSYLAALRILALHRRLKWRLALLSHLFWSKLVRWGAIARHPLVEHNTVEPHEDEDDMTFDTSGALSANVSPVKGRRKRRSVHWASDDPSARTYPQILLSILRRLSPISMLQRTPRWIIYLAALVFLRSAFFRSHASRVTEDVKARLQRAYEKHPISQGLRSYALKLGVLD